MPSLFSKILVVAAGVAIAAGTSAHASAKNADKSVPALSGRVFAPPPPAGAEGIAHIHLTQQDLYQPPASSTTATNAWGAAGAGAAAVAASGPPPVYTTMAAAAAAGVEPFQKPQKAEKQSAPAKPAAFSLMAVLRRYALTGVAVLAGIVGLIYVRRRRGSGA